MGSNLFGAYWVKPAGSAMIDANRLFPKCKDYQLARRHALKLAFWPGGENEGEPVVDMDWEWIRARRTERIGEMRIHERIGGHRNLRIVFWVADKTLTDDPLPRIWTLSVLAKKRQDWTSPELKVFSARRKIVIARNYKLP